MLAVENEKTNYGFTGHGDFALSKESRQICLFQDKPSMNIAICLST